MIAEPIEEYVWCDWCGEPHPADLQADPPTIVSDPNMECVPRTFVKQLPSDWERQYHAEYADKGYDLFEKSPALQPCHRPMYYLLDSR